MIFFILVINFRSATENERENSLSHTAKIPRCPFFVYSYLRRGIYTKIHFLKELIYSQILESSYTIFNMSFAMQNPRCVLYLKEQPG